MTGKREAFIRKLASMVGAFPRELLALAQHVSHRAASRRVPVAKRALLTTAFALFIVVGTAAAARVVAEGIIIVANGSFKPTSLPKRHNAPIAFSGSVSISTVSGALPPTLQTITLEIDRHGSLQTTGLGVCTEGDLQSTTVAEARKVCSGAVVGEGEGNVIVKFGEGAPIPDSLPITLFNGPTVHGDPSILAHAYTTVPVATTFVVPIVLEPVDRNGYGYRAEVMIPQIAGGNGVPISGHLTIGRKWTYKGRHYSYLNARCEVGFLQTHGLFSFSDGFILSGTLFKPCTVRG